MIDAHLLLDPLDELDAISPEIQGQLLTTLVDKDIITLEQAHQVLARHEVVGTWVGQILVSNGLCSRLELFTSWAECLGTTCVDLIERPPDPELMARTDTLALLTEHWVPFQRAETEEGSTLVIATADPGRVPYRRITQDFPGDEVQIVLTTDWDILQAVMGVGGPTIAHYAAEYLAETRPDLSARYGFSWTQKLVIAAIPLTMIGIALWNRLEGLAFLLTSLNIYFDISIATKALFCLVGSRALRREEERHLQEVIANGGESPRRRIPDAELPVYTILIPCYKEANVIGHVLRNIQGFDYPLSKLQVLVLLESDDTETIEAAKATRTPDFMRIVVLPEGEPRTKPRACNIGLTLTQGEFLVIYDAEDRPDPS
jgi:glycosyltransferase XagB